MPSTSITSLPLSTYLPHLHPYHLPENSGHLERPCLTALGTACLNCLGSIHLSVCQPYTPKNGASGLPGASANSKPSSLILQTEFTTIPAYEL